MSWSSCISGTIICAVLSFIVVGIPIIVYEAVVKPRDPTFTLDHAAVTGFNLTTDGHLTAFFDVVIRANNPNHKLKLKYRGIRVSIYKDKQNVAEDAVPGFNQHKRNVTMLRSEPVALNVSLKKGPAFDFGLESGIGYLDFDVFMTASLNSQNLEVDCQHAVVNLTSPASYPSSISNGDNNNNNNYNGQNFRQVGCSVYIYSDDD